MDMLSDEYDSFDQQQSLFRPTELAYCRNLVDLLTEELNQFRRILGEAQRANRVLIAERDILTAEVQRHRLRYVKFVQEENQRHVPRGDRLIPDDRDDPLSRAQRHILRLESMNSVLHADLFKVRAQLQVLLAERGGTPSAPAGVQTGVQHG